MTQFLPPSTCSTRLPTLVHTVAQLWLMMAAARADVAPNARVRQGSFVRNGSVWGQEKGVCPWTPARRAPRCAPEPPDSSGCSTAGPAPLPERLTCAQHEALGDEAGGARLGDSL